MPDSEILLVQGANFLEKFVDERLAELDKLGRLVLCFLQFIGDFRLEGKELALQRSNLICSRFTLIHAEEFEVAAEVEDIELVFILSVYEPFAEPRSATDHLPEFRLAHDLLEEDKVQNFGHVDTRVEHIDRDCDLRRQLLGVGEIVDRFLREFVVIIDDSCISGHCRILLIEDVEDLFGVAVVLRKDNRLAEVRAVMDAQPALHQDVERLNDRVFVEEPFVDAAGGNAFGKFPIFVRKSFFIDLFFFVAKVVVDYPFFQEF